MATVKELQELEQASNAAAEVATAALDASLRTVMIHIDRFKQMKPKVTDEATYRKLIALVQDATRKNESIATLRANVERLGGSAVVLLNDMVKMVGRVV